MRNENSLKNKKTPFNTASQKTHPNRNQFFNSDSRNRAAQPLAASSTAKSTWFYCDENGRIVDDAGREMITYQICTQAYNTQKDPLFVALYKLLLMNKINNREMICKPVVSVLNTLINAALNITSNATNLMNTNISTISAASNIVLSYTAFNLPVILRRTGDSVPQLLPNGTAINEQQLLVSYDQISMATGFNIVFGFLKKNSSQLNLPAFAIFQSDSVQATFDKIKAGVLQALSQLQTPDLSKQANVAEIFVIIGIVLFSIMMFFLLSACAITCGICVARNPASNSPVASNHEPDADMAPRVTTQVDLHNETGRANAEQPAEMTVIVMPPLAPTIGVF